MHDVRARANGDQPGERTVVHEARVVSARDERGERAARHRHQRVHRDQAGDLVDVCALITLNPNQPTESTQAPSARKGMVDGGARPCRRPSVAAAPRAQQQHRDEADPAAHRVHDDAAREIVELRAERRLEPGLKAEGLVPAMPSKNG